MVSDSLGPPGSEAAARDRPARLALTATAAALLAAVGLAAPESRYLQVLSLFLALSALAVIGGRVAGALLPEEDRLGRVVPSLVSAFGTAILLATGLGHFGFLDHRCWFLAMAAALLASWLLPRSPPPAPASPVPPAGPTWTDSSERALAALAIGAVVASLATRMLEQRFEPVGLGFDDASYHLTAVATWNRFGDLRMWKFPVGDGGTTFYPIGGELWSWTLLAPLRDSDLLARWSELPFAAASLLALLSLGRRLGLTVWSGVLAAVLFASNQEAFSVMALGAGNDHSNAFFGLAALDGALVTWRRRSLRSFAYTGVALGLLAGIKYLGLLHAGALGLLLAAGSAGAGELAAARRRRLFGGLLTTAAVLAAVGGYCYLRNLVSVGNPLFPLPVFGLPGWPGVSVAERAAAAEFAIEPWRFLTTRPDIFGPLFAFTLLPAALIAPLLAAVRRRWHQAIVFLVPAVLFFQFLWFTHDHRRLRYFLAGVAVAALAVAWLLERLPRRWQSPARAAILLAVLWTVVAQVPLAETAGRRGAIAGLAVALAIGTAAFGRARWFLTDRFQIAALVLLPLLCTPALAGYVKTYQARKLERAPAAAALESLTLGRAVEVAYTGHNSPYLFYGRRLQNGVEAVPRSGPADSRYYQWGDTGRWPFDHGRYSTWDRNLRRLGIDYVVVLLAGEAVPERTWMLERPAQFQPVFQWREYEIYRVAAPRQSAGALEPRPGSAALDSIP